MVILGILNCCWCCLLLNEDPAPNFSTGMNAINSPGDTTLDPNFSNGMNANNSGDTAILDPNLSTGINSINSGDTTIDPNLGSGINSINSGEDANAIETDRIGHTNSTATRADEPTIAGPQFERIEEAQQPLPEQQMAGRRPRKDFGHRLKEVQAFKTKHGHCMIPHKYKRKYHGIRLVTRTERILRRETDCFLFYAPSKSFAWDLG